MKKQALLLIALVSCANASALTMPTLTMPAMPTIDVQAYKEALSTAVAHKNTPTVVCSTAFAAVLFYTIYRFYVNGGYATNPGIDWTKKDRESDFMKHGYTNGHFFDTTAPAVVTTPVATQEATLPATPVTDAMTQIVLSQLEAEKTATEENAKPDYFDNLVERQMEILE